MSLSSLPELGKAVAGIVLGVVAWLVSLGIVAIVLPLALRVLRAVWNI